MKNGHGNRSLDFASRERENLHFLASRYTDVEISVNRESILTDIHS